MRRGRRESPRSIDSLTRSPGTQSFTRRRCGTFCSGPWSSMRVGRHPAHRTRAPDGRPVGTPQPTPPTERSAADANRADQGHYPSPLRRRARSSSRHDRRGVRWVTSSSQRAHREGKGGGAVRRHPANQGLHPLPRRGAPGVPMREPPGRACRDRHRVRDVGDVSRRQGQRPTSGHGPQPHPVDGHVVPASSPSRDRTPGAGAHDPRGGAGPTPRPRSRGSRVAAGARRADVRSVPSPRAPRGRPVGRTDDVASRTPQGRRLHTRRRHEARFEVSGVERRGHSRVPPETWSTEPTFGAHRPDAGGRSRWTARDGGAPPHPTPIRIGDPAEVGTPRRESRRARPPRVLRCRGPRGSDGRGRVDGDRRVHRQSLSAEGPSGERSDVRRPPTSGRAVQGKGWARKKSHMIASALTAALCGPRTDVSRGGIDGPPGHSWPSPEMA